MSKPENKKDNGINLIYDDNLTEQPIKDITKEDKIQEAKNKEDTNIKNNIISKIFGNEGNTKEQEKDTSDKAKSGKLICKDVYLDIKDSKLVQHVAIDRFTGGALSFNIDASFSCLMGVIGGNGWAGSNQSETRKNWASLYLDISEQGKEVTKILSPSTGLPIFKFSRSLPDGSRIAAGSLSFKSGGNYISGNFSIQVQGGATGYEANILVKNTQREQKT